MDAIHKILAAVDFSGLTDKVLDTAVSMCRKFDSELRLVYVVEDLAPYAWVSIPHVSLDVMEEEMTRSAEGKLERLVLEKLPSGISCTVEVRKGSPAKEIIDCAKKQQCSLIVMGTHGYRGMEKVLLGSVAAQVLQNTPCPILVVNH